MTKLRHQRALSNFSTPLLLSMSWWDGNCIHLMNSNWLLMNGAKRTTKIRSSHGLKADKCSDAIAARFVKKDITYGCTHGGTARDNKVDNSRKNQKTNCLDCPFRLQVRLHKSYEYFEFTKCEFEHNHPIGAVYFENLPNQRRLNEEQINFCKPLFDAHGNIRDIQRIVQAEFNKTTTVQDLYNAKNQLKGPDKDRSEDIRLIKFIEDFKKKNQVTIEKRIDGDDVLQCKYLQTDYMKDWFNNFGSIIHVDSTFKVNIENYLLYICLTQNENLKGVPVAYCFMKEESLENLSFWYQELVKGNDKEQQIIMVDKDLTNLDLFKKYFKKPQIWLCTFHVLKYIKTCICGELLSKKQKEELMEIIMKCVYTDDINEYEQLKLQMEPYSKQFYDYFIKNWDNCQEMWMHLYRRNMATRGTNTNNHIESFNRTIKRPIIFKMHITDSIKELMFTTMELHNEILRATCYSLKINKINCERQWLNLFVNVFNDKL